jgi:hypothetical protein
MINSLHTSFQHKDEEQSEQLVYTIQDTQQALQVLIEYTGGQKALQADYLKALERLEAAIGVIKANSQVQSTLDSWIR